MSDPDGDTGLHPTHGSKLRIAGLEYDPEDRSFTRRGERLPLVGKPLELVEYMLARGAGTFTIAQLKAAVWPNTAVSDNSVYKAVSKIRDALGPGLIETRRKLGFQLARQPVPAPPSPKTGTATRGRLGDDGPFVGQEALLADLRQHLDAAGEGSGRLVCLVGDAGAGKTRIATELARLARDRGHEVHWGGCSDPEAGEPRRPWQEIAKSLGGEPAIVPHPTTEAVESSGATDAAGGTAERALEALTRAAAAAPRLLVIDDAQWADREATGSIRAMAEHIAELRVLMLVLIRSPAFEATAPGEGSARIAELAHASFAVPPLREGDVAALLRQGLGAASAGALAGEVWRRTDGNAYFATEMIRWIESSNEHGELRDAGGLPESIRSAIESRLAVLPDTAGEVLGHAAMIGYEFDPELLARSLRWTASDLSDALAILRRERLLRDVGPEEPPRLRFDHHLVQEVAALRYDGRGARIHWEIAEAAEELYGDDPAAGPLIARHMALGVEVGDPRRAVAALRRAADCAMRELAHSEAAMHLRSALRVVRRSERPERERAEILLDLGRALLRSGNEGEAAEAFHETARIAETLDDPPLLGRAALGFSGAAATVVGAHEPSLELVQRALAALGDEERALRVRLQSREAMLCDTLGRQEDSGALADRAVALAEALDDPAALATAYRVRNTVGVSRVREADSRIEFASRTLRFAADRGDTSLEVDALIHRGVAELQRGEISAARRDFREARGSLRGRPPSLAAYPAEIASVLLAVLDGELSLAAERAERAYALGTKVGHADARLYRDIQRFQLAYLEGNLAELGERGLADLAAKSELVGVRTVSALMLSEADRLRQARSMLSRLVAEIADAPRDAGWLSNVSLLALVASRVQDEDAAAALHALLDPYEPFVVSAFCVVSNGPVAFFLGLLDTLLGNADRARLHLGDAVARCAGMRIEPWLCLSKIALAECTAARDAAGAREHVEGAIRLARGMGMDGAEARAAAVLRGLDEGRAARLDPSES